MLKRSENYLCNSKSGTLIENSHPKEKTSMPVFFHSILMSLALVLN